MESSKQKLESNLQAELAKAKSEIEALAGGKSSLDKLNKVKKKTQC